jgi:uncharacterized membrane protein (DUF485 family)
MSQEISNKIAANPAFQRFVSKRNTYAVIMTILGSLAYYGFILLVAYNPALLAQKLGAGMTTSLGVPIGVGVIVFTIIITWIFVRRSNTEFDDEAAAILKEATK